MYCRVDGSQVLTGFLIGTNSLGDNLIEIQRNSILVIEILIQ